MILGGSAQPMLNGHSQSLINGTTAAPSITPGPAPSQPFPASQTPVSFTNDQISALRAQIHAFKLLSRGQTVPEHVQHAIRVPNSSVADLEKVVQGPDVPSRIVDAAVKATKGEPGTPAVTATVLREGAVKPEELDFPPLDSANHPKGPFFEDNVNSGIYPYNAYRHPFSHLKRPSDMDLQHLATRLQ